MGVKHFAVLGHPVDHSLSPAIHRAAYEALELDWEYTRVDVEEQALEPFLADNLGKYAGFSLTMPLKEELLRVAKERGWSIQPDALMLSSANTVYFDRDLNGFSIDNTDLAGASAALKLVPPEIGTAVVLGSGATARTVSAAILASFANLEGLTVFSRRQESAQAIADLIARSGRDVKFEWLPIEAASDFGGADLTVNTLPSGVAQGVEVDLPFGDSYVFDVTYDNRADSIARHWPQSSRIDGRAMLIYQAVEQLRLFGAFQEGKPDVPLDAVVKAMFAAIS